MQRARIAIISTGGTIEKTYDELEGVLSNQASMLDVMLATLQLPDIDISRIPLMNKDSLDMTEEDQILIATTVGALVESHDGVIVIHGTDRLSHTGEFLLRVLGEPEVPVVLTGAMRPYELRNTDAIQNLTEALLAVRHIDGGVYAVMHNRVLPFPGVVKDRENGTFILVDVDESAGENPA